MIPFLYPFHQDQKCGSPCYKLKYSERENGIFSVHYIIFFTPEINQWLSTTTEIELPNVKCCDGSNFWLPSTFLDVVPLVAAWLLTFDLSVGLAGSLNFSAAAAGLSAGYGHAACPVFLVDSPA